jgi:AraC-like DNA-binding protein
LYVLCVATRPAGSEVSAWRPAVPGIAEVFHAHFVGHAYPSHTHEVWTLLIVDDGAIRFDLDRHEHGAVRPTVTLLPPHVPHDGRSATDHGFRKRVLYLDTTVLGPELAGAAVDQPSLPGRALRYRIHQLHQVLADPTGTFEAECRLAFIRDHLVSRLQRRSVEAGPPARDLAGRLRELLDARTAEGVTLAEAAAVLHAHPAHLVRAFTERHGLPPHRYLTGRRVELARRLLLAGQPPASVAVAAGFCDQSHLTRTFRRHLGVSPARYARGGVPTMMPCPT